MNRRQAIKSLIVAAAAAPFVAHANPSPQAEELPFFPAYAITWDPPGNGSDTSIVQVWGVLHDECTLLESHTQHYLGTAARVTACYNRYARIGRSVHVWAPPLEWATARYRK